MRKALSRDPGIPALDLYHHGRRLGKIARGRDKYRVPRLSLHYDRDYLAWEGATPISLSLPLQEAPHDGERVGDFLSNLLPESMPYRESLAECFGFEWADPFSLIACLGRRAAGAVVFVPEGEDPGPEGAVSGKPVPDEEIESVLANLEERPLGVDRDFPLALAGAQRKTALLRVDGEWRRPAGCTPTTHILKPQIGRLMGATFPDSVENEFLCQALTPAFGLATAPTEIGEFGDQRAIVVERFDREWTDDGKLLRVPHEDFLQAIGNSVFCKYEGDGGPNLTRMFELLRGSVSADEDRRVFLKAQVVFWLLAAIDGHPKNYCLRLLPGGEYRLAPFFDIVSFQWTIHREVFGADELGMSFTVGTTEPTRAVGEITPRHFVESGEAAGIPAASTREILSELVETRGEAFDRARARLPDDFPPEVSEPILDAAGERLDETARYLTN